MKATYRGSYKTTNKTTNKRESRFSYEISGTEQELADYRKAKGNFYAEDKETGAPIWNTVNYVGQSAELGISRAGNVFVNTGVFDQLDNLIKQYPGALGELIVKQELSKMSSIISRTSLESTTTVKVEDSVEEQEPSDFKA